MTRKPSRSESKAPIRTKTVQPGPHDSYAMEAKPSGSKVCDVCGVVHHAGRWSWRATPIGPVSGGRCPACQRIDDHYPAGIVRVPQRLVEPHGDLLNLIRNVASAEREEHPLERIMAIEHADGALVVTTTGTHLARRIASKLSRQLHEKPAVHQGDGKLRLEWPD